MAADKRTYAQRSTNDSYREYQRVYHRKRRRNFLMIKRIARGGPYIQLGPTAPGWKGGRHIQRGAYVYVWVGKRKYRKEHILIAEKVLGRLLKKGEVVHHINGIKSDNIYSNLLICTHNYHRWLHDEMGRRYQREHF